MHPIERHVRAKEIANNATFKEYGIHGPYLAGTKEHLFWLESYEDAMNDIVGEEFYDVLDARLS